jgi:hypothetical protein
MSEPKPKSALQAAILEEDDAPSTASKPNGRVNGNAATCPWCNKHPQSHGDMCDSCWTYSQTGVKPKTTGVAVSNDTGSVPDEVKNIGPEKCKGCKRRGIDSLARPNSSYCEECRAKITPEARIADKRNHRPQCQTCRKNPIFDEAVECTDCISARIIAVQTQIKEDKQQEIEASEDAPGELKYPQLVFPYDALPEGRFRKLVDKACEGGLSPGLVVPSILALVSSIPLQDRVEGARINLYVTLLTMVGAGKDTAIDRAGAVLGLRTDDAGWASRVCTVYTPSGERSIAMLIGDQPPSKSDPVRMPGYRTHCMVTYELDETLRKNKGETSGVFTALQHFFDHNEREYNDSKYRHKQTVNCRLSWLTALPVGEGEIDENVYRRAFGDSSSHGFVSRMVFGFAEQRFDRRKTRNWGVSESDYTLGETREEQMDFGPVSFGNRSTLEEELRKADCKGFAPGVAELYENWKPAKDWSGRDLFHVLKIAALCAILQGHEHIEKSDWHFAVAFMEWQGRIRQTFAPSRAKKTTQAEFNEIVIKEVEKRTLRVLGKQPYKDKHVEVVVGDDGKKRVYIRWKAMSNDGKWHLHGLDVEKTIKALVRGGSLEFKRESVDDKQGNRIKEEQNDAWVRVIGFKPGKEK